MSLVLDSSVALGWCFEDQHTAAMKLVLQQVVEAGALAPQLWPLEVLNALLAAQRRRRLDAAGRREVLALLYRLPIAIDPDTATHVWSATQAIAESHDLAAYDAAYLELAMRLGLPLATLDRKLATAAGKVGVPLLLSEVP